MDPFKRKLFTMKYIVMLEWLKKCVINLHSVTAYVLAEDPGIMNTVPVLFAVCSPNQIVDSVHRRLSPWDHLVKSRQLGSSGQQFTNFVSKNLPRECSLPTANLSDQALDNAHGAWFWLSDIKCKKIRDQSLTFNTASISPISFSHDSQLASCAIKTSNDFPITLLAPVAWVAFVS